MKLKDRREHISKLTDLQLIHHSKELEQIHKTMLEDLDLLNKEIAKRANKVIKRNNPNKKLE